MKLYAISDLHLDYEKNRDALRELRTFPEDWLILAGDLGHQLDHYTFAFDELSKRFAKLVWCPGNHDLWTAPGQEDTPRGEARYYQLVEFCRQYGVITPEDPYPPWPGPGPQYLVVPLFLLYDYSFRPKSVDADHALDWASKSGVICADEYYLQPDPFPSRPDWCHQRCEQSHARISQAVAEHPDAKLILINHWPFREEMAKTPRVPRFSLWCGTKQSREWHTEFPVAIAVYGHLHLRRSTVIDRVRFEEVSLGYPRNWDRRRGMEGYLRQILPQPTK